MSVHTPLTKETHRLINAHALSCLSPDCIFVNTSRGEVVGEQDLVAALRAGKLKLAGLDVFEREPLGRDSKILGFPQVVTTPHIGARTAAAWDRSQNQSVDEVLRYIQNEPLRWPVPPQVDWVDLVETPK